ncbi:MAG: serine O-acetyltransferase [Capnocytophaga sp.]|nr:serine O-acetyltransferase [Capnocytophaga sp.]
MKKTQKTEQFIALLHQQSKKVEHYTSKLQVEQFIEELFRFLFLIEEKVCYSQFNLELRYQELRLKFVDIVSDFLTDDPKLTSIATYFDNILPEIHEKLQKDAQYFIKSDPAATSLREVQVSYPGFFAIMVYRLAHELWELKIPLLPRMFTEYAHSKTGIDIHPGAVIGVPFMIDHGTGTVIGETTIIGDYVKVYQGVTLGALSVSVDKANTKRHPTIGDNVVIYSGATILGGETHIGRDSIIGGNVWLTQSIEPDTKVFHKSQIIVKDSEIKIEPINFVI